MQSRLLSVATFLQVLLQLNGEERQPSSTCGIQLPVMVKRITGGNPSTAHWPWHAAIYYVGLPSQGAPITENDTVPKYQCGGTLIDENTVLTAAHCVCRNVETLNAENVLVSLGIPNLSEVRISEFLKAMDIIKHPNYSHDDLGNDIAVIRLSGEVTFDAYVQPICLWDSSKSDLLEVRGKIGMVVGWGRMETGRLSDALQQARMPVVDDTTCLESDRNFYGPVLSSKNYCAGFRNGTGACNGDSGGSMAFEINGVYYIRGVVSFTKGTKNERLICEQNAYTLFTDVAQYLSWIGELLKHLKAKCDKRVSCEWSTFRGEQVCQIDLNVTLAERNCKVIVDENPRDNVGELKIVGNVEALPDLSDVFDKFNNISRLNASNVKLKSIERNNLFAAKQIKWLFLHENEIEEISPDTFDDLSELEVLKLSNNSLKVIHRDTFQKLYKLKTVFLRNNDLEVLPEGAFRNNLELEQISSCFNKLRSIEIDFRDLPELRYLDLRGNECSDQICWSRACIMEFQSKTRKQCRS